MQIKPGGEVNFFRVYWKVYGEEQLMKLWYIDAGG